METHRERERKEARERKRKKEKERERNKDRDRNGKREKGIGSLLRRGLYFVVMFVFIYARSICPYMPVLRDALR